MVETYLDNRPDRDGALRRALLAEHLAIFVYLWPPYAAYNSPAGNARVRERTSELAARWLTAVA